jgi:hypothetical protein
MENFHNLFATLIENFPNGKLFLGLALGIGLSASSGFRVFIPLLIASVSSKLGIINLGNEFQWMSSTPAIIAFSSAALFEIVSYYVPIVDNFLDTITSPLSIVAGTLLTASVLVPEMDPMLKWSLGFIVGGGSAGIIQAGTTLTRATSTVTTGGIGNPIFSTIEHILALLGSILSIFFPLLIAILFFLLVFLFLLFKRKRNRSKKETAKKIFDKN